MILSGWQLCVQHHLRVSLCRNTNYPQLKVPIRLRHLHGQFLLENISGQKKKLGDPIQEVIWIDFTVPDKTNAWLTFKPRGFYFHLWLMELTSLSPAFSKHIVQDLLLSTTEIIRNQTLVDENASIAARTSPGSSASPKEVQSSSWSSIYHHNTHNVWNLPEWKMDCMSKHYGIYAWVVRPQMNS